MPALPAIPGVLNFKYRFRVGVDLGATCRSFMQFTGGPPTSANCSTIAGTVATSWASRMAGMFGPDRELIGVDVTDLSSSSAGFGAVITSHVGTRNTPNLPGEVCALQNYKIGRRYRGGKPRIYWPAFTGIDLSDAQDWFPLSITDFNTAYQLHLTDIFAITTGGIVIHNQCSVSYYHLFDAVTNPITGRTRDVPRVRAIAIAPDPITGLGINSRPASQRRRALHSS